MLYLHRHAKSSWDYSELSDFDRPLNSRGLRDAPKMGERLKARGEKISLIVSSPAVRALSTARLVAKAIDYPEADIREERKLYLPRTRTILEVIQGLDDVHPNAMLFGHNPGFTEAVGFLSAHRLDNLPTAGQVCISFPVDHWSEVQPQSGTLKFIDYPKRIG